MSHQAWKKVCSIPGCSAPAAALGACTTHLGLNGQPRVVPVPPGKKRQRRARGVSESEAEFAAMVAEHPGQEFEVPADVMPFEVDGSWNRYCDRVVKRINRSAVWSRLPGTYRCWSRGGVAFATWLPEEEVEEVVVADAVSKRYA